VCIKTHLFIYLEPILNAMMLMHSRDCRALCNFDIICQSFMAAIANKSLRHLLHSPLISAHLCVARTQCIVRHAALCDCNEKGYYHRGRDSSNKRKASTR